MQANSLSLRYATWIEGPGLILDQEGVREWRLRIMLYRPALRYRNRQP